MKPRILARCAVLAAVITCGVPAVAQAHPLGNFTVNRSSRIEPAGDGVRVQYVLDMAEIPTFQDKPAIDAHPDRYADEHAESIRQNLHLTLGGQPIGLRLEPDPQLARRPGWATVRLEATYWADLPTGTSEPIDLTYRDDNEPARIGWREIVVRPSSTGAQIQSTRISTSTRMSRPLSALLPSTARAGAAGARWRLRARGGRGTSTSGASGRRRACPTARR